MERLWTTLATRSANPLKVMHFLHHRTDPNAAKHCNLKVAENESASTDRLKTGLHGLTNVPAKFKQKATDCTLSPLKDIYCFLGENFLVTQGSEIGCFAF